MIKTVNLTTAVTAVEVTGKQNVTIKNMHFLRMEGCI